MATRSILIKRPPHAVWSVLRDGSRYHEWVVGTHDSRPLDQNWPAAGSAIEYTVRIGRRRLAGRTVVREVDDGRRLELEAQSGLIGSARIGIETRPWGEDTLVTIDEHPLTGLEGRLHNVLGDALLQLRHRRLLRKLAEIVQAEPVRAP